MWSSNGNKTGTGRNGDSIDRSRPGSGRSDDGMSLCNSGLFRNSNQPTSMSTSSSFNSLSPSSPLGEFPSRPRQLPLPSPGGGLIPDPLGASSPMQQNKRTGLKISFSQPNLRAKAQQMNNLKFPATGYTDSTQEKFSIYSKVQSTGKLKFGEDEHNFCAEDLVDCGEIGRGNFGAVNKMMFRKAGRVMAVKRIRSTVNEKEQKQLLMDLEVVMNSSDCSYIVQFYGAIFKEGDCWICMELMDTSLDKFYHFIFDDLQEFIPEAIIGKITLATVKALNYLKEKLKIMHRDVKPSNILLDKNGAIKLCDFGISGQLVDSIAKTRDAGCRPYMAPERIDPQRARGYDVRSDVWSLGITLIELATGKFPYPKWNSVFEQLTQVVHGDPPRLMSNIGNNGNRFTIEFINFVNLCLMKDESVRPKYTKLLEHPFLLTSQTEQLDTAGYVTNILDRMQGNAPRPTETMLEKMEITDKNGC